MPRFQESPLHREILTDLFGATVCCLDNIASERSATYTLDAGALFSGSVPSDDPRISILYDAGGTYGDTFPRLAEGVRLLYDFRAEDPTGLIPYECRFAGPILQLTDRGEPDVGRSSFVAFDPWQYLYLRPVVTPTGAYPDDNLGLEFYSRERGEIALQLLLNMINNADGTAPPAAQVGFIDAGPLWGGTAFYGGTIETTDVLVGDLAKPGWSILRGTSVGQAWTDLAQLPGLDIVLTPIYDPINRPGYCAEVSIYAQAGTYRPAALFSWDQPKANSMQISRFLDGTQRANTIQFYAGQSGIASVAQLDFASIATFGEYWRQQFIVKQPTKAGADLLAERALALQANGKTTYTVAPAAEFSPLPFTDYELGDTVPVTASDRLREEIFTATRVYGFTLDIGDDSTETVRPNLTSPDGFTETT